MGKYHDFMEAYQKTYQMLENNLCTKMAISYGNFQISDKPLPQQEKELLLLELYKLYLRGI